MTTTDLFADPVFIAYFIVFGLAALGCFASVPRLLDIDDRDTRRSMVAFVLTSGGWALALLGFLAAPTESLQLGSYVVGLILGFGAVWMWLYFCSAYTGRGYHLNPRYRRLATVVFLVVIGVKIANPLHHEYFTTATVTTPFPHLTVQTGPLHWTAMGLSYALAFVGFFMLFELFTAVDLDTRALTGLVGLTALPVVFDIIGFTSPTLIDMTYEPLGVAVFAIGVAFVYPAQFERVRFAAERDTPLIAVDGQDRIRDSNTAARALFPALEAARGQQLAAVIPTVSERLGSNDPIVEVETEGATQYYRMTENPLESAKTGLGKTIVFEDVTEREQYRHALERQNERLERFASMISHDLRNPLSVAMGRVSLIEDRLEDPGKDVSELEDALERMEELIADVLALAREGQPVEEWVDIRLTDIAEASWGMVAHDDATIHVESEYRFRGDEDRLKRLFENLFRNAIEHGGESVTVEVGPLAEGDGFYVSDDGPGIPAADRESVFDFGYSTAADGTGFGLAIVAEIVNAHDWSVTVAESESGGARFEVRGVERVE